MTATPPDVIARHVARKEAFSVLFMSADIILENGYVGADVLEPMKDGNDQVCITDNKVYVVITRHASHFPARMYLICTVCQTVFMLMGFMGHIFTVFECWHVS